MSLSFLSVDAAVDRGDIHPVAVSAIERAQRDLGATFEERNGWLVPVSIPGEDQYRVDLGHRNCHEVRSTC